MRLPSFSSLLAFDAVARHGTLTRAAVELNVSQPAVSRRIAALEADLGRPLLDRRTKPLSLNKDGTELYEVLRSSLGRLEAVVERLRRGSDLDTVTINAGAGLTAYWLIPRLPQIEAAFPKLKLRIVSQSHDREEDVTGDLQVRFGDGKWPRTTATKLWAEEVFPVCSPLHLGRRKPPLTLEQLKSAHLLDMKVTKQTWYDWGSWFEAVGAPIRAPLRAVHFDSYPLVVDAALAGHGVCLCWDGLLDRFLESGSLVRLSPLSATSARGYFVTHDPGLPSDAPARAVARWFVESSARPVKPTWRPPRAARR
jgi:DNA-binding transcriptional LysR family regulator